MKIQYRPEIDGLRTIAVISVLIYHLKIPFFDGYFLSGGYLGVDIFFVLSGYLITSIIHREILETGRFSFMNFYSKRIKRIIPPLILVILVSLPVAWLVLLPTELMRYVSSLLAALGFYSNIFWFLELGEYGAQSGLLQPMLHTWSLSIEEQFYVLFPIVFILLCRIKNVRILLGLMIFATIFSLYLAQVTTEYKPPLSFFSPVSRAWELLAGATLAVFTFYYRNYLPKLTSLKIIPVAMIVIILTSLIFLDMNGAAHPGYATVPVVFATCGLIYFSHSQEVVTQLLSSRPFVWIGKLSYSLYLWHYPIFAFARLTSIDSPTILDMILWVTLTFICAWLGYKLIERPFRFKIKKSVFFVALFSSLIVIILFSFQVNLRDGIPSRFSNISSHYGDNEIDNEVLRKSSFSVLDSFSSEEISMWNAAKPSQQEIENNWFSSKEGEKVLIVGNSHSKDMFNALYLNRNLFEGIEFARYAIGADLEPSEFSNMYETPNFKTATTILISPKYRTSSIGNLQELIPELFSRGKKVILVGNTAEFVSPSSLTIFDWYMRRLKGQVNIEEVNGLGYRYEASEPHIYSGEVKKLAKAFNIPFYDRRELICFDVSRKCSLVTLNGRKTMYDDSHWTLEGAEYFGLKAYENGWFIN
ncbi:MAG: acyltransferase family protein [Aliiglaciecola sp.]|uniref:acyltransferase family protein n=1 Tax=Aliiglaciecola sp. TaxID=1872441 RepID=UPI00329A2FA2